MLKEGFHPEAKEPRKPPYTPTAEEAQTGAAAKPKLVVGHWPKLRVSVSALTV
jgi:hypothetical protein